MAKKKVPTNLYEYALGVIYGGLREYIGIRLYLHGSIGLREKSETSISCRGPGPTDRRKRYTSSQEEEDVATNMCSCGTTIERRTHTEGECAIYKEERDALEEMRKLDVCDMEEFRGLESSEQTIAILGGRWWPQTAKQKGEG